MRKILLSITLLISCAAYAQKKDNASFTFAFFTDLHLRPDVVPRIKQAIDSANEQKVDFTMLGGDQVFDVMRGNLPQADSLFSLFKETVKRFAKPVYHCIGNHDLFGIYPESEVDSTHPAWRYGLYEKYFGKTYYSFDHKGWHFIVLNSIDVTPDKKYKGIIGKEQMEWIKQDLAKIDTLTPVVVTTHIPLMTAFYQVYPPKEGAGMDGKVVANSNEVLALFRRYNLKLVLQGHLHWKEDLYLEERTHFVTGGSIAGRPSWRGTVHGDRGFMLIKVADGDVSFEYKAMKD